MDSLSYRLMNGEFKRLRERTKQLRTEQFLNTVHEIQAKNGKTLEDPIDCQCCGRRNIRNVYEVNGHLVGEICKGHPQDFPCRRKEA